MKRFVFILLFLFCIGTLRAQNNVTCLINTELGNITIELFPSKAPITVTNFLKYVDAHLYNGSSFFRAVTLQNQPKDSIKIEVIQGGDVDSAKEFEPIVLETTKQTGLLHVDGTISMARGKPASATSSFFICINNQPSLDYGGKRNPDGQGFAAFGKVINGMDIVKKIQQLHPEQGQYFNPPVKILSIIRK
ncbi:MAG: peptidylprolyl isomerase [Ferruginibacter sp.]|nr:peptidylprolyl isomerase [Ferruginibacter sp.]